MKLQIKNNITGEEWIYEDNDKWEVLVGSGAECDIILTGKEIFAQHARFIHASNHLFVIKATDLKESIEPVIPGHDDEIKAYNWGGRERRIDGNPLDIGQYTVNWC